MANLDYGPHLCERDTALAQRKVALAHIAFLKSTRFWRITWLLRALLQLFRYSAI